MAAKIIKVSNSDRWVFECPACECCHYINNSWTFNGDTEKPTISPSIKLTGWTGGEDGKEICCHFFIKNGWIEYCGDCTHKMVGKRIELPDLY